MNPDRWRRIEEIFTAAHELEPGPREAYLTEACEGDEALRKEVEALLRDGSSGAQDFMKSPALEFAARALAEDRAAWEALDLTGRTIGHNEVLQKLGEGGMGVVYKARDEHLERFAALKVLAPGLTEDPGRKRSLIREARASSALNHPNIVTIYDIDSADGIDYIAMEYIPGKILGESIPREGMELSLALRFAVQVADALGRAHAADLIHRDLKPGNIIVGDDERIRVLDFGFAKLTETLPPGGEDSSAPPASWSEAGAIIGTAPYMSPEQVQGKAVDKRSDIFSFGSTLYEMVTGRRAFQ